MSALSSDVGNGQQPSSVRALKRRGWLVGLLGIFGIAKAQTNTHTSITLTCSPEEMEWCKQMLGEQKAKEVAIDALKSLPAWHIGKPRNNQCPVCGTMAPNLGHDSAIDEIFKRRPDLASRYVGRKQANTARCYRCNAAFWQDET